MTQVAHVLDAIVDVVAIFLFVAFAGLAMFAAFTLSRWGKSK